MYENNNTEEQTNDTQSVKKVAKKEVLVEQVKAQVLIQMTSLVKYLVTKKVIMNLVLCKLKVI